MWLHEFSARAVSPTKGYLSTLCSILKKKSTTGMVERSELTGQVHIKKRNKSKST